MLPPANEVRKGYVFTGVCPPGEESLSRRPPPVRLRVGGTHPTGMQSCYRLFSH